MRLTVAELVNALDLEREPGLDSDIVFTAVSTDTRTIQPGDLFVALANEKADGHDHLRDAVLAGAKGVVVAKDVPAIGVPVFRVPDTLIAYGRLARANRDRYAIPVIGVTGSVGKTTAKEMLAAALSPFGPALKTEASQNNETGVPKALLRLDGAQRAAIIEMGMRGAGQIAYLCGIARPNIGLVTVIADNHIELLSSRDAIADAKGELLESLAADGLAVLNADDPYYPVLRRKAKARVLTFGLDSPADFRASQIAPGRSGWSFQVRGAQVHIPSASRHDIGNALAALAVAVSVGVPLAAAAAALGAYVPPPMRMEVLRGDAWSGTILNDSYNAAPASVHSALRTLCEFGSRRKIAFLGDMKELGDLAVSAHEELGNIIERLGGVDALYTVGELAGRIPGAAARFSDSADAARFAEAALPLETGDIILVKGSRAMAMEHIANALARRKAGADAT